MSSPAPIRHVGRRAPLAAALAVAGLTIAAAILVWRDGQLRQQRRFEIAATSATETVRDRLHSQIALLHGGAGLFAAAPAVSCRQFGDFVQRMQLEENYPGTQGMGFSIRTDLEGARGIERLARSEGLRDFRVWPGTPRAEYHVIRCIEPRDRRNVMALGYDMYTDAVRREAMARARDTGRPALSGRVHLVQEIDPVRQAGFLIYVPVYAGDVIPPDVESRRSLLRGFVYSPLRGDDFLEGALGGAAPLVGIEVFDGPAVDYAALLHSRDPGGAEWHGLVVHHIEVGGRQWTLRLRPAPALSGAQSRALVSGILASGGLLALLLYLALSRAHRSAAQAAAAEARARESSELAARGAEQLALIMDAAPALVSFIDTEERYVVVNRRYTEWLGLRRSEIEGRTVREVLGPQTYGAIAPALRKALAGEPGSAEAELRRSGGHPRFLLASYMPHRDRHGHTRGVVALLADITGQKEAQRVVAESEANLRAILNASLDAVVQMNAEGRIIFWNPRAEDIFGWSSEEACGRLVRERIVPPASREAHARGLERFLRTGERHILGRRIETAGLRKDGSTFPIELAVTQVGSHPAPLFNAFIADLSERNRAQEVRRFLTDAAIAFSSSIDRARVVETIVALAVPRLATGAAVVAPSAGGAPEVIARAGSISEGEAHATAAGLDPARDTASIHQENGIAIWPLTAGAHHMGWLLLCGDGSFHADAHDEWAVAEEYSRRASMALHHAQLYEQAEVANRLKDEFLSTLSHELRTPANAILGWAQIARDGILAGRDSLRALDAVLRNAHTQNELIEQILDVQRLAAGKVRLEFRALELGDVVRAALDAVRPAAMARHIALTADLDDACPVSGDPDRLQQVFWNLLSNAVKFTPDSGTVRVEAVAGEGRVLARVVDTGPGIPPAFLPHVFERFRQADASTTKSVGGLGLGLTIAKTLVELHGGSIAAANRHDGQSGAVFTVSIPLREAEPRPHFPGRSP